MTALLGALVWALLEPVPVISGLLAIVAWGAVVRWRYAGGWLRAGVTGIAAWAAAVAALAALDLFGVGARRRACREPTPPLTLPPPSSRIFGVPRPPLGRRPCPATPAR